MGLNLEDIIDTVEARIGDLVVQDTIYPSVTAYNISGQWRAGAVEAHTFENFGVHVWSPASEAINYASGGRNRRNELWIRDTIEITWYYRLPPLHDRRTSRKATHEHTHQLKLAVLGIIGQAPNPYEFRYVSTQRRETEDGAYIEVVLTFTVDRQSVTDNQPSATTRAFSAGFSSGFD